MTRVRCALGATAVAWLLCQLTTLMLVPTVLMTSMADMNEAACTCPLGADATCPMHQHKPAANSGTCVMRSLTTSDASTLTSLLGSTGFLPVRTVATLQTPPESLMSVEPSMLRARQAPPDPPPPRA